MSRRAVVCAAMDSAAERHSALATASGNRSIYRIRLRHRRRSKVRSSWEVRPRYYHWWRINWIETIKRCHPHIDAHLVVDIHLALGHTVGSKQQPETPANRNTRQHRQATEHSGATKSTWHIQNAKGMPKHQTMNRNAPYHNSKKT